jgi:hypothetical protein
MKKIALLAATALVCTTSLTPAFAQSLPTAQAANTTTQTDIQQKCDAAISGRGSTFSVTVTPSLSSIQGAVQGISSEVTSSNTRIIDESTRAPTATATILSFSNVDASGANVIVRNGGSPNLFAADAVARTVTYSDTTYNYSALYSVTTVFTFDCLVSEQVTLPNIPAVPDRLETQGECMQRVQSDSAIAPNQKQNYCSITANLLPVAGTGTPEQPGGTTIEARPLLSLYNQTEDQTDEVRVFNLTEQNGGQATLQNQTLQVQAVVCNSPGRKGGIWTPQNGYGGLNACQGAGSYFTNAPISSNSLPTG